MTKVNDVVCGSTIDLETAETGRDAEGREYYFCSTACREAFEAHPERYVHEGARSASGSPPRKPHEEHEQAEQHEPPYTITGLLASPKFGAAGSGGLEYELLPEAHERSRK